MGKLHLRVEDACFCSTKLCSCFCVWLLYDFVLIYPPIYAAISSPLCAVLIYVNFLNAFPLGLFLDVDIDCAKSLVLGVE